jgi:hypothetical protein
VTGRVRFAATPVDETWGLSDRGLAVEFVDFHAWPPAAIAGPRPKVGFNYAIIVTRIVLHLVVSHLATE